MTPHYAFLLFMCFAGCECNSRIDKYVKVTAFADQMCPPDQVEFTTVTRSAVSCVQRCSVDPGCTSLVYLHGNRTCFGVKFDDPFTAPYSLPGAVFYRPKMGTPMAVGLPDSQFTASSFYDLAYAPWKARFSNDFKAWSPATQNANQWIQVSFTSQILATHVLTKGRTDQDQWVTSYKVLTSTNCINYVPVKDHIGNEKVFAGNVDRNTPVQHALEPPVMCLCFRINPLTWYAIWIDVRMEVLGHVM